MSLQRTREKGSPESGFMPAKTSSRSARTRDLTLNIRTDSRRRNLIDRAAEALGQTRSEFMLAAACREAESVLLDQRFFLVDEAVFADFQARIEGAAPNPVLSQLLDTPPPWKG